MNSVPSSLRPRTVAPEPGHVGIAGTSLVVPEKEPFTEQPVGLQEPAAAASDCSSATSETLSVQVPVEQLAAGSAFGLNEKLVSENFDFGSEQVPVAHSVSSAERLVERETAAINPQNVLNGW